MVRAFLTVNTVPDRIEQVLNEIRIIDGVEQAFMVYGIYDLVIQVYAKNLDELRSLILKIRKMSDVFHLLVQIVRHKEKTNEYALSVSNINDYSQIVVK